MSFNSTKQQGTVCQTLTQRCSGGPFWEADAEGIPRPTDAACKRAPGYSSSENVMIAIAWNVWNADLTRSKAMTRALAVLDGPHLRMVGELFVALSTGRGDAVDDWICLWTLEAARR
jgi:hypothetical protein